MPDRFLTAQSSVAGCLFQSAIYGACMSLFGMPVDALLLGAIAAGIAHGLREQTTRRVGWSRIGIGTWDSDSTNWKVTVWAGARQVQAQLFYPFLRGRYYLRVYIGWKSVSGLSRLMLASHINPFRTWRNA